MVKIKANKHFVVYFIVKILEIVDMQQFKMCI